MNHGDTQTVVTVVAYDPSWPARYEAERRIVAAALGGDAVLIEHIGSTSVPGLAAKPIIDIVIAARRIPLPAPCVSAMEAIGYEHLGEYGIPGREYFRKIRPAPRTHHVHVYAVGDERVAAHLVLRDYLRSHPSDAERYGTFKRTLASTPKDAREFSAGKAELIAELLQRAREWRGRGR